VEQALAGHFQRANLIALRERVVVCLTIAPSAQRLRRARLAAALDAPQLVLTVLDSHRFLSRDEGLRIEQCEQLCADLGGEFLRPEGRALLTTLVEVARSRRITQIVLGQSRATSLAGLLRRPLSEQLQRQLRGLGIDLHLIAEPATELTR
jgi:two-component system sensor histidine kinase KdpD